MRTLVSLLVVVGIVAGFALFTILLPRWRTGYEKVPLVRGEVVASPELRAGGPVTLYVELLAGRPGGGDTGAATIDDASPDPTLVTGRDTGPSSFRFELSAGPEDGPPFFLRGSVETTAFQRYCAVVPLPPAAVEDGEWVARGTGRPLEPVRMVPRDPC